MKITANGDGARRFADKVRALAEGFGRRWSLALQLRDARRDPYPTLRPRTRGAPSPSSNADVVLANPWVTRMTPAAKAVVLAAMSAAWERGVRNGGALMLVAAQAWRGVVLARSRRQMTDSAPPRTTSEWSERKRRLGLAAQDGTASGQMAHALETSTVIVRKVSP